MEFIFGRSSPSAMASSEGGRKKVRKDGAIFSGDVARKKRVEEWMKDEEPKVEQADYRESLLRNLKQCWCDLDEDSETKGKEIATGFDEIVEPTKWIDIDLSNPLCPNFVLDKAEKERLLKPFRRTLIVKLMGITPNYEFLKQKFHQIWARSGEIRVFDLPNEFYLEKFEKQEDYDNALIGRLWVVAGSYLSVMRWRSDFNPKVEVVDRVVAWVRFPDLSATHFDRKFLLNVGNVIGKAIRMDLPTTQRGRGKFARLCVELDLTKSLIPQFCIEGRIQAIEYECMSLLCLHCGRYGHVRETCGEFLRMQREKESCVTVEKEKSNSEGMVREVKD